MEVTWSHNILRRGCNTFDEIKAARDSESDVQVRRAMTKAFEKCEASRLSHAERN